MQSKRTNRPFGAGSIPSQERLPVALSVTALKRRATSPTGEARARPWVAAKKW